MTLPNFLIVGAAKSGTTSLFEYLAQHPEIYVSVCKELHYFSDAPYPKLANSDKEYEKVFVGIVNEKAIGESSVSYLSDVEAPYRIKNLLKDVKIIILLRNPADRAYALWCHMYRLGYEKLTFSQALSQEVIRLNSVKFKTNSSLYHGFYCYFTTGMYYEQVKRYLDIFGKQNVRIYIFEEFVNDLENLCSEIFEYLGVNPDFKPELETHNKSHTARLRLIQRFLFSPPAFFRAIYDKLPDNLKMELYKVLKYIYWLNIREHKHPPLHEETKQKLMNKYLGDIKKLEKLLNRDLTIWYAGLK